MQPDNLMEKSLKCFKTIKKLYSSMPTLDSDENSDTDLVSHPK